MNRSGGGVTRSADCNSSVVKRLLTTYDKLDMAAKVTGVTGTLIKCIRQVRFLQSLHEQYKIGNSS